MLLVPVFSLLPLLFWPLEAPLRTMTKTYCLGNTGTVQNRVYSNVQLSWPAHQPRSLAYQQSACSIFRNKQLSPGLVTSHIMRILTFSPMHKLSLDYVTRFPWLLLTLSMTIANFSVHFLQRRCVICRLGLLACCTFPATKKMTCQHWRKSFLTLECHKCKRMLAGLWSTRKSNRESAHWEGGGCLWSSLNTGPL